MSNPVRRAATVVLMGDSITQASLNGDGWGSQLANYFTRRADVLNRGFSGYNTEWLIKVMEGEKIDRVCLVVIFMGANDSVIEGQRQHISIENFSKNLEKLFEIANNIDSEGTINQNVIFITPPPTTEITIRKNSNTQKYAAAVTSVCNKLSTKGHNTSCINLFDLIMSTDDVNSHLSDGLHLSQKGNNVVFKALIDVIKNKYPKYLVTPCKDTGTYGNNRSVSDMDQHAPWHNDM